MTTLVMFKSITWNGHAHITVPLRLPLLLTDAALLPVCRPGAAPWSWKRPWRFMVPVPGQRPLPPPVSGERPAATAAEAPPAWGSSSCWRATPPVVISVSRTSAPRRGSASGSAAFLTVWQLYSYPATAQIPSIKLTHCISCISWIFKLYKGEARRVSGHPNAAERTIVAKRPL